MSQEPVLAGAEVAPGRSITDPAYRPVEWGTIVRQAERAYFHGRHIVPHASLDPVFRARIQLALLSYDRTLLPFLWVKAELFRERPPYHVRYTVPEFLPVGTPHTRTLHEFDHLFATTVPSLARSLVESRNEVRDHVYRAAYERYNPLLVAVWLRQPTHDAQELSYRAATYVVDPRHPCESLRPCFCSPLGAEMQCMVDVRMQQAILHDAQSGSGRRAVSEEDGVHTYQRMVMDILQECAFAYSPRLLASHLRFLQDHRAAAFRYHDLHRILNVLLYDDAVRDLAHELVRTMVLQTSYDWTPFDLLATSPQAYIDALCALGQVFPEDDEVRRVIGRRCVSAMCYADATHVGTQVDERPPVVLSL